MYVETWNCRITVFPSYVLVHYGPNALKMIQYNTSPDAASSDDLMLFTGRNEVVAKVIFLHLSVILFTGVGVSASVHAGIPIPTADTPLEKTPLGADPSEKTPQSRHPPGADTPREQTAPWEADFGIRSMSGRYASYWNAFLLLFQ